MQLSFPLDTDTCGRVDGYGNPAVVPCYASDPEPPVHLV